MYKVQENQDVTIIVKFTGTPQPTAEWFKENAVLKIKNKIEPKIDEESATLTIKKVIEEDAGDYTLKLKNPSGEAEAYLHLVIKSKITFKKNICIY